MTTARRTGPRLAGAVAGLAALTMACTPSLAERPRTDDERGRAHLVAYGCTSCHRVPGIAVPQGQVGPPLGAFGERRVIAGLLPNNPDNAVRWIRDPQQVNPRTVMPDLGVTDQDARDIVAYLYGLRDTSDADSRPPAAR